METIDPSFEKDQPSMPPETISVRGMTRAVEIDLVDQLLPPIDKEQRKEWKRLQREKENQQD